jgi:cbb3-type cytochrome oxidase maturation protein
MIMLYVLVPLGLALCGMAVWAFFWAVDAHQFEDLDAASISPLEEDQPHPGSVQSAPDGPPTGQPSSP